MSSLSGVPGDGAPQLPGSRRPGSFGYHSERRSRPSDRLPRCRICWEPLTETAPDVEEGERYPYLRCPSCGHSFPIRQSDLDVRER